MRWRSVLQLSLFALLLTVGCGGQRSEAPPNVILLVMDTVRADHLGCYGYERATSPTIDAFAATATVYDRAIASAPWSIPSHASIFTGKDPFQHGGHRVKNHPLVSSSPSRSLKVIKQPLGLPHKTLAQMFQEQGYRTAAIVANDGYLSPKWGMTRGFDTYNAQLAHAGAINERVLDWIDAVESGKNFFLFINYMDAHKPYNTKPRPGLLSQPVDEKNDLTVTLMRMVQDGKQQLPQDLVGRAIDQYDTGIANLDLGLGDLFEALAARGILDNSVIVITSDHGEAFGEHRFVLHGNDVYEEEVWVPLIVRAPGQRTGQRVSMPVSGSDIPRLIFRFMPERMLENYRMDFPNAPGNHPVISQNYFSFKQMQVSRFRYDRVRTAVYDWPYKLIHSSDGESELYHLEEDPGERNNRIEQDADIADALATMLREYRSRREAAQEILEQPTLTDEEIEKLKTLGYIGN